jgi:predicted dienelactone hydrolase
LHRTQKTIDMKVASFTKILVTKVIVTTTLLLASGMGYAENRIDTQRPDAPELAAYGSSAIGVRTLELLNVDQLDIAKIDPKKPRPEALPRYDRPLAVEVWYPAKEGATGSTGLKVYLRDASTEVTIEGKAMRDASPAEGRYPLLIVSHGYPGNRYLMSHLAENLASKGYVVASIGHTDSTYRTLGAFASTQVNRSLDQLFVLAQMDKLSKDESSFLHGHVDASNTGLIGYSMGGYGAVITSGGGISQKYVNANLGPPFGTLGIHQANSATHNALPDNRIKTAVAFAPWGMNVGMWDKESLQGLKIPMLFIAGSVDDVSGYEKGTRAIWQGAQNIDRSLLTFENANHNAGATIPAPEESFRFDKKLGFNISEHYSDSVWSNTRMNNVAQHFVTAWMAKHLKSDNAMDEYTHLVERSNDGVWAIDKDGTEKAEHTYWKGFANRTAKGLRFETRQAVK